jgi:hypothetical protein
LLPQEAKAGIVTIRGAQPSSWGDDIPDDWRLSHFGSLSDPLSKREADPDADGASNWAEFKAGTSPNDNRSFLRLLMKRNGPGFTMHWPTVLGKIYVLERSPSLVNPDWVAISPDIAGTADEREFTDYLVTDSSHFYRIRVTE